jgi:hypothetical protein
VREREYFAAGAVDRRLAVHCTTTLAAIS